MSKPTKASTQAESTSQPYPLPGSEPTPEASPVDWIVLAQLLRPQGRKGEILAELLTDRPEQFDAQSAVFLAPSAFTGAATHPTLRSAAVVSFFLPVGRNEGRIVLHFSGVDSIEQAEKLAGLEVIIPREGLLPLEDDANYVADLIGCSVYDGEVHIGTVADLQFTVTPDGSRRLEDAAPLLEVTGLDGEELLIPYAKHFLVSLDVPAKKIVMNLPAGLLDINKA